MRVSVAWLRELVDLPEAPSADEIAERLTMAGLEVEAVEDLSAAMEKVTVARIEKVRPHPHADHLEVCEVDLGDETVTVVCGAPNTAEGVRVVLARPGALVSNRLVERVALRGVVSDGVLCSERELGLGDDHSGIMILDDTHEVGTPMVEVIGADAIVLEVAVTPNRPDALSHVGIARELAALAGGRLKVPTPTPAERGGPIDDAAHVTINDTAACPRYACRVIDDISIGPSPAWLRQRLQRCGMRSVNNIVDVTNLVLLERGHPLHAFDADRLGRDRGRAAIVVRRAVAGERLVTIDGEDRALDPVALAGIMGGQASEVTDRTARVLLESAYFDPAIIRRGSRRHGLHTESSHRFERGCDPNRGLEDSLHRAAQLIAELGGGTIRRGVVDVYPKRIEPRVVSFRPDRAAALLGVPVKFVNEADVGKLLGTLGIEVSHREGEAIHFRIPTWRPDLEREVDLVEEVVRLLGMDRIEETLPRGSGRAGRAGATRTAEQIQRRVRDVLLGAGFDEAVSLAFMSPREDALFADEAAAPAVSVRNALGEEQSLLRRTLLVRLLGAAALNQRRGSEDVRLFEVGTVFLGRSDRGHGPRPADDDGPAGGDAYVVEEQRVAGIAVGQSDPVGFDTESREYDFFDLKGVLEGLLAALGRDPRLLGEEAVVFEPSGDATGMHPRSAVRLLVDGEEIGFAGEVHPDVVEAFDVRGRPVAFELHAAALERAARLVGGYRSLPRFPKVRRDVALILGDEVTIASLVAAVRRSEPRSQGFLVDVGVFDVYRGSHVPPGKKSVALAFEYRAPDRTLVDDEVNTMHATIIDQLVQRFQAEVRK